MSNPGRDALVAMLSRLKSDLQGLNLSKPEVAKAQIQAKYPLTGDYLVEVRRLWQRGLEEGWLGDGPPAGPGGLRLTASTRYFPYSIDALMLEGAGTGHRHPKGEISLAWQVDANARYCDEEPGWAVCAPGSKHVPRAKGGTVFVLTFLPDGKVEWDARAKKTRADKPAARRSSGLAEASRAASAANRVSGSRRASAR